jgi:hypothetical protein
MKRILLIGTFVVSLPCFASVAQAQIVSDHTGSSVTAAIANSLTWSHVVGSSANRILLVGVQLRIDSGGSNPGASTRVTAITFGGTALTCLIALADNNSGSCGNAASGTGGFLRSEIWFLLNPATSTANIIVSTNNSTILGGGSVSYSNVLSAASGGGSASNNGTTGTTVASLGPITTPTNGLVVDSLAVPRSTTNVTASGTGHTALTDVSDPTNPAGFHIRGLVGQNTSANPTIMWTLSPAAPFALAAAVLTPAKRRKAQTLVGEMVLPEDTGEKPGAMFCLIPDRRRRPPS